MRPRTAPPQSPRISNIVKYVIALNVNRISEAPNLNRISFAIDELTTNATTQLGSNHPLLIHAHDKVEGISASQRRQEEVKRRSDTMGSQQ